MASAMLALAFVPGLALTFLEAPPRLGRYHPFSTAIGPGTLIPGFAVIPMEAGGIVK